MMEQCRIKPIWDWVNKNREECKDHTPGITEERLFQPLEVASEMSEGSQELVSVGMAA
jgi:hypothetical protein